MFIPYRVDVPFNHRPVVNWVVVAGVIVVFCLQVHDMGTYPAEPGTLAADPNSETGFAYSAPVPGGITGRWLLNGWGIKGLFGHMWLHGGVLHLIGNLIFLPVCRGVLQVRLHRAKPRRNRCNSLSQPRRVRGLS